MIWPILRHLLFQLDAETAHELTLRILSSHPRKLGRLARLVTRPPSDPVQVVGTTWSTPVGLAAGLDKDGRALPFWEHLGFGAVEIGTVTAHPQLGNPKPRLHRLVEDRAIINRMGFNNHGSAALAERLQRFRDAGLWPSVPVGINLGKSKITPLDRAVDDYMTSLERVKQHADWITVNVSSPNTPGLRELQRAAELEALLRPLVEASGDTPMLLKLSPDLADDDLREAVEVAIAAGVRGVIATNTTLSRDGLTQPTDAAGGLSGAPLWPLARARIGQVLEYVGGRVDVIGVGGIHSRAQVHELLEAGCAAVQLYSGLIYEGPTLPARLSR